MKESNGAFRATFGSTLSLLGRSFFAGAALVAIEATNATGEEVGFSAPVQSSSFAHSVWYLPYTVNNCKLENNNKKHSRFRQRGLVKRDLDADVALPAYVCNPSSADLVNRSILLVGLVAQHKNQRRDVPNQRQNEPTSKTFERTSSTRVSKRQAVPEA